MSIMAPINEPTLQPPPPALFAQSRFAIVRGRNLDDETAQKLAATIKLHGGHAIIDRYPQENLPLEELTHIISSTFDFPDYDTACDALIPVVKLPWIDTSLARDKLANTRQFNPDPRLFLSEVVVCCADLPDGDADAIAGGVLAMGGLHTSRVTSQVTHIVALTMESDKCALVLSKKLNVKIVLPHWFDDCLKLGKRIDERPYMLPDPEILHQPHKDPPRATENKSLTGAIHPDPSLTPSPTPPPEPRKDLHVFEGKNIILAKNLGIGTHLRNILEEMVTRNGGYIVTSARSVDMYICKYREGEDYKIASRAGKDVGNLAWLYYLITNNVWTSPTRRLLHYPIAREGLPGFKDLRISLSNYSGEARVYLENLVLAAGAECTKTLKQDNTHLITAHVMSEKCAAAKDWGIHLVNHLWLEDSYAKWKIQSITNTRYTHFPLRTNLGEVVGQTKIDRTALERNFFSDEDMGIDVVEPPNPVQERDVKVVSGAVQQSSMADSPMKVTVNVRSGLGPPSSPTPRPRKHVGGGEVGRIRTPATPRFVVSGKENGTPSTTASRKSKDLAAARLQNIAGDIALYEKEKKRVGGVVYGGGRRKNDEDRVPLGHKRSFDDDSDTDGTETNEPKRLRTGIPPPSMHLLISGYKKWVGHGKIEDKDKKTLRSFGIIVTHDPSRASHLAAPQILRTHKFISALAYAPTIISTDFIDACLEKDELLDTTQYLLQDKANEEKFGISLAQSQELAKTNRNQLFHGHIIYCIEHIRGGFDTFKSIIEANGGQCNMYRGRPGVMVPSRRAGSDVSAIDDSAQADVCLISGPEKDNGKLWKRFKQMAEGSRKTPRIVEASWLLDSAMAQKILPVESYELTGKNSP